MNPIGIVVALPAECRSLGIRLRRRGESAPTGPGAMVALSGAGPANARQAAQVLADRGVHALLSWGCCAALSPDLRPGDLVAPDRLQAQNSIIPLDNPWQMRLRTALSPYLAVRTGLLVQSDTIVARPEDKRRLALASGAVAVDMESAAIAQIAAERRLPCAVIRSVADAADFSMPNSVLLSTDADGETHLGRLLRALLAKPAEIPALLALGRHFAAAMNSLELAARLAGPDFLLHSSPP